MSQPNDPSTRALAGWSRHAALNLGQAVRDARELDLRGVAQDLYYAAVPPLLTHHTPDDVRTLNQASRRAWFLHGMDPDKHKSPVTQRQQHVSEGVVDYRDSWPPEFKEAHAGARGKDQHGMAKSPAHQLAIRLGTLAKSINASPGIAKRSDIVSLLNKYEEEARKHKVPGADKLVRSLRGNTPVQDSKAESVPFKAQAPPASRSEASNDSKKSAPPAPLAPAAKKSWRDELRANIAKDMEVIKNSPSVSPPAEKPPVKKVQEHVVAHIAGPSGSGKTTLLNSIKDKHPHVVALDLDELDEQGLQKLGLDPHQAKDRPGRVSNKHPWEDSDLEDLHAHRQEALNRFLETHAQKPVVLAGIHIEGPTKYDFHAAQRLMLDTTPVESTRRAVERSRKPGGKPLTTADAVRHVWQAHKDIRELERQGYSRVSPEQAIDAVAKHIDAAPVLAAEALEDKGPRAPRAEKDRKAHTLVQRLVRGWDTPPLTAHVVQNTLDSAADRETAALHRLHRMRPADRLLVNRVGAARGTGTVKVNAAQRLSSAGLLGLNLASPKAPTTKPKSRWKDTWAPDSAWSANLARLMKPTQ